MSIVYFSVNIFRIKMFFCNVISNTDGASFREMSDNVNRRNFQLGKVRLVGFVRILKIRNSHGLFRGVIQMFKHFWSDFELVI